MKRFGLTDAEGGARSYFDTRDEVRDALRKRQLDGRGDPSDCLVWTFDASGKPIGTPEWGDDVLNVPLALVLSSAQTKGTVGRKNRR